MGKDSSIEWTNHTFSPWWGCARVSPGCEHCYAESFAKRVGQKVWGVNADRRRFGDKHWVEPLKWNAAAEKAGERRRVFCASMADVFEDRPDHVADRARLFALIESTPHLDWLLLTKRPENMNRLAPESWRDGWPANVWAGTTCEDQKRADVRIRHLQHVPARVRFLSCEPLLERVDLGGMLDGIHWVIVGGESGGGARRFDTCWADAIVDAARVAGAAIHVKQMGARPTEGGAKLKLRDRKGGDWTEWREGLRVREYPDAVKS